MAEDIVERMKEAFAGDDIVRMRIELSRGGHEIERLQRALSEQDAELSRLRLPAGGEAVAWRHLVRTSIPHPVEKGARVVGFVIRPGDEAYGKHGLSEATFWLERLLSPATPMPVPPEEREALQLCFGVVEAVLEDVGTVHDREHIGDALEEAGIIEWRSYQSGDKLPRFEGAEDLEHGDPYWTTTPKWASIRAMLEASPHPQSDETASKEEGAP